MNSLLCFFDWHFILRNNMFGESNGTFGSF
jgi:hypothetical protein